MHSVSIRSKVHRRDGPFHDVGTLRSDGFANTPNWHMLPAAPIISSRQTLARRVMVSLACRIVAELAFSFLHSCYISFIS
jgi:hypothetical protein